MMSGPFFSDKIGNVSNGKRISKFEADQLYNRIDLLKHGRACM